MIVPQNQRLTYVELQNQRHFGSAWHGNADPPAAVAKACNVSTQGGAVCVRGFVLF